ncbi:MAG: TIGR01440 family protein [Lysinibacillus sp.]
MITAQSLAMSLQTLLHEFEQQVDLLPNQLFVVGCSTSEVVGEKIGTAGALDVAETLYSELQRFANKHQLYLVFQGCEHINRALTLEAKAAQLYNLEPVSVVPVSTAGGSMSAYAYSQMDNPVVVEHVAAHAGIDIGQTLIGMHLKVVAVPIRTSIKHIGEAIVTVAKTRPKLIGGERAQYN